MKLGTPLVAFALSLLIAPALAAQYTVNMRDVDVRAFASDAAKVTGLTLVVDGRVNQKISVVSQRSMSRTEYFEVFLSTLRANGLVAIPIRGGYRIQPFEGAASQPTQVTRNAAASSQFVTEVIRLRSLDAAGALETVRPLVSPQGTVTANRNANSLVVVDFADNVRRIRQLLASIQGGGGTAGPDTQIVYLRNAGPREIASSLQQLGGTGANVSVSAMDSANAILLRGDPAAVARFASLIRDLDARAVEGTEIRVYWLEHADAEQLMPVLQQLVGQAPSEPSAAPDFIKGQEGEGTGAGPATPRLPPATTNVYNGGTGIVRRGPAVVARYPGTNAVIIAANLDAQRQLGEVIRQLDTRREQVLVEAIIVEIGNDAARRLGVQFLLAGKNAPFAATNWSSAQPSIFSVGAVVVNETLGGETSTTEDGVTTTSRDRIFSQPIVDAATASTLAATGGFGGGIVEISKNLWFGSILNAVQSDTESNILSTPSIMTLDNHEARLLVGQEVPVTTGEKLGANFENAFRTVERQNVGIQLDVKPQVNSSGSIKLFIRQEVSSVAGPVSARNSDLIINKREFKTVLTVDNGEILAIGGLLDDNERRTIEKIPLLSDIPIIGELFKNRNRSRSKTNLMVFIRPTIIRTREEARALSAQRYGYIRGGQIQHNPNVEPSLDSLVRDYLGTVPPQVAPHPGDRSYSPTPVPPPSQPQ